MKDGNDGYDAYKSKQETLEEVAENYAKQFDYAEDSSPQIDFMEGAKWQEENSNVNALDFEIDSLKREIKVLKHQQERSYSEEDMRKAYCRGYGAIVRSSLNDCFYEWFEQFKKK